MPRLQKHEVPIAEWHHLQRILANESATALEMHSRKVTKGIEIIIIPNEKHSSYGRHKYISGIIKDGQFIEGWRWWKCDNEPLPDWIEHASMVMVDDLFTETEIETAISFAEI